MKPLNRLHRPSPLSNSLDHVVKITNPLTETDILDLQDTFLRNGFQHIKVKDVATGRRLVNTFLNSLAIYHNIACVTTLDVPPQDNVTNVYHELTIGGYLDPLDPRFLDEFFIEDFYFDFMWIEATNDLINNSSWYKYFEKKLLELKLEEHIPMIVLSVS